MIIWLKQKTFSFAPLAAFVFPILGSALIAVRPSTDFAYMSGFAHEGSGFLLLMPLLIILAVNLFFF